MRLYDHIAHKGVILPDEDPDMLERLKIAVPELLSRAVVVSVDNIFSHLSGIGDDGREGFQSSGMPSQVSPWPVMFAEWRVDQLRTDDEWFPYARIPGIRMGWLVETIPHADGFEAEAMLFMLAPTPGSVTQGPMLIMRMAYDQDGRPVPHSLFPVTDGSKRSPVVMRVFWDAWDAAWQRLFDDDSTAAYTGRNLWMPVSMAIGMMHCKNVSVEDGADTRSRQQRRHDARHGIEPTTFKTLVIDPSIGRKATSGQRRPSHDPVKRLHICRGHFSTYTEEKPLFGKYSGTFWIPAHVRGSAEVGEVRKDYRVKAGAAA